MSANTERLENQCITARAFLAAKLGRNLDHLMTSTFSLGVQDLKEHAPRSIGNTLGQMVVSQHSTDIQVLDEYPAVVLGVGLGNFEQPIPSLSSNLQMSLGNGLGSLATTVAALDPAAQPALLDSEFGLTLAEELRRIHRVAV